MKAQVLTDFITKYTISDNKYDLRSEQIENLKAKPEYVWMLHVDGAYNAQGSGAGLILINFEGTVTEYAF